jgi:uncharacterized protein with GYD domain
MPLYLTRAKYAEPSLGALPTLPTDMPRALGNAVEAHGGRIHHYYWTFGDMDAVFVFETPTPQAAKAVLMTLAASGTIHSQETMALLSNNQAITAMEEAGGAGPEYVSPLGEWEGWRDFGGEAG